MNIRENILIEAIIKAIKTADSDNSPYPRGVLWDIGLLDPTKALHQIANSPEQKEDIRAEANYYLVKGKIEDSSHISYGLLCLLTESGIKQSIKVLPQILLDLQQDEHVRATAAWYLGKLGDTDSLNLLFNILQNLNEPDSVRYGAVNGIAMLGGDTALQLLTKVLRDKDSRIAKIAIEALGQSKNPIAFEPLIQLLNEDNETQNVLAMSALYKLDKEKVFELFLNLLGSEKPWIRRDVASILGFGYIEHAKQVIEPLIQTALEDPNSRVRGQAVAALSNYKQYDPERILESVIKAFDDSEEEVITSACYAAMYIQDNRLKNPLLKFLKHSNHNIRYYSARALGQYNDQEVISALEWVAQNDYEEDCDGDTVAESARYALKLIQKH
jgi:HEAT repeat protein